jgi:hypothetical protein
LLLRSGLVSELSRYYVFRIGPAWCFLLIVRIREGRSHSNPLESTIKNPMKR